MQFTQLCHNIIHLEEIFEDNNNVYLVMEYVEGGDLLQKLLDSDFIKEEDAKDIMI